MEWLNALRETTVAVDTAPFIYFIEENPVCLPVLQPFFRALDQGDFRVVTSVLTLTEVLVHPLRNKDTSLRINIGEFFFMRRTWRRFQLRIRLPKKLRNYVASTVYAPPMRSVGNRENLGRVFISDQ